MKELGSDNGGAAISVGAARLAIGGTLSALGFLGALHVLSPGFDPAWRMVSEYANGHYPWVLSLMFGGWAVGTWALAYAIRGELRTISARIGLGLLVLAGIGEAMAAVFDLNNITMHNVAGVFGMGCLPIAAMVVSIRLARTRAWSGARMSLLVSANLTWISLVLLVASFVLMVATFVATGLPTPAQAPRVLPHGVIGLVGYANRLLVLCYCLWVVVVAREAIHLGSQETLSRRVRPATVRAAGSV
jgi:hypothetical protein